MTRNLGRQSHRSKQSTTHRQLDSDIADVKSLLGNSTHNTKELKARLKELSDRKKEAGKSPRNSQAPSNRFDIPIPKIRGQTAIIKTAPPLEAPRAPLDVSPREGPLLNAPPLDAPLLNAPPLEASLLEAPPLEAPPLEAPLLEALPLDAPPLDTPPLDTLLLDTPLLDAPFLEVPPFDVSPFETSLSFGFDLDLFNTTLDAPLLDTLLLEVPPSDMSSFEASTLGFEIPPFDLDLFNAMLEREPVPQPTSLEIAALFFLKTVLGK